MRNIYKVLSILFITSIQAHAQTTESIQEEAQAIISALQYQRNAALDSAAQLSAQVTKLTKELNALKKSQEPKKD